MSMTEQDHNLLSLFADLKLTLGDLRDTAKRREQRELQRQAKLAEQPSYNTIHGNVQLNGTGFGVIRFNLPGPNQGFVWNVRTLVIGGSDPTVAVAGRADVFVRADDLRVINGIAGIGLSGWRDTHAALPMTTSYGEGEMFCHANDELWVVITGGTANQQLAAIATVQNVQESAKSQVTAV